MESDLTPKDLRRVAVSIATLCPQCDAQTSADEPPCPKCGSEGIRYDFDALTALIAEREQAAKVEALLEAADKLERYFHEYDQGIGEGLAASRLRSTDYVRQFLVAGQKAGATVRNLAARYDEGPTSDDLREALRQGAKSAAELDAKIKPLFASSKNGGRLD